MTSKDELQNALKEKYGINKNISQSLSKEECEQLLQILDSEVVTVKLVKSFAEKNGNLGDKNRALGRMRTQAESKLEALQAEYAVLEASIEDLEISKLALEDKKKKLEQDREKLEEDIRVLSSKNEELGVRFNKLIIEKEQLVEVNHELKKDNKYLKNVLDKIKVEVVVKLKDAYRSKNIIEIKRAIAQLVKWIAG